MIKSDCTEENLKKIKELVQIVELIDSQRKSKRNAISRIIKTRGKHQQP